MKWKWRPFIQGSLHFPLFNHRLIPANWDSLNKRLVFLSKKQTEAFSNLGRCSLQDIYRNTWGAGLPGSQERSWLWEVSLPLSNSSLHQVLNDSKWVLTSTLLQIQTFYNDECFQSVRLIDFHWIIRKWDGWISSKLYSGEDQIV